MDILLGNWKLGELEIFIVTLNTFINFYKSVVGLGFGAQSNPFPPFRLPRETMRLDSAARLGVVHSP